MISPGQRHVLGFWLWAMAVLFAGLLLMPLSRAWALAPDLGHGWAAPILAAYLWWEGWSERPGPVAGVSPGLRGWMLLLIGLSAAIPLRLFLTPYPLWPVALILYVTLLMVMALGIAGYLAGRPGVKWLAGPLIVLPGALPWPGAIERVLILPLREGIATLVAEISNLFGHPALAAGTSVQLVDGWVGIDEACGGIRSLQAAVMTALFFGEWLRLSWGRRLALIIAGALAAVVGNFGRVLFLAWCAGGTGETLANWHDPAGWVALGFSLVATGVLGWSWRRMASPIDTPVVRHRPVGMLPRGLCIWMLILAVMLLAIEGGTRWWFFHGGLEQRATVPQWGVHFPAANPSYRLLPLSDVAREMLRPDGYQSGVWRGVDGIERSAYYIEWRTGQVARSVPFMHNPTVCLPYAGCELLEDLGPVDVPWRGGTIPFHAYVFSRMNEDMVVAFIIWDSARGRPLESMADGRKAWWHQQWRDVLEARENQPAQLLTFAILGRENHPHLALELSALISAKE